MTVAAGAKAGAAMLMIAAALGGCGGSGARGAVHASSPTSTQAAPTSPPTSSPQVVPTVFDCGGGAYEPKTLLVVCGVAATTVTDIHWTAWTATGATGSGNVHLSGSAGHGSGPATLSLAKVVESGTGPQFSRLQVSWTGTSPDGRPTDQFDLAVAPG